MLRSVTLVFVLIYLVACEKEDIGRKHAEAVLSFDSVWEFNDAIFSYEKDGTVFLRFNHNNDSSDLVDQIRIKNFEAVEGVTNLRYVKEGSHLKIPTAFYDILIGGDVQGEIYVIDSTSALNSELIIDCVSKNKITGKFNLYFVLSELSGSPKFANYIPDTFSVLQGKFNAKRID